MATDPAAEPSTGTTNVLARPAQAGEAPPTFAEAVTASSIASSSPAEEPEARVAGSAARSGSAAVTVAS